MEKQYRMWLDEHEAKYLARMAILFDIIKIEVEKTSNTVLTFVDFKTKENWEQANYILFRLDMFSEL